MSTYVHRFIEVKLDDNKWHLVDWISPYQKNHHFKPDTAKIAGLNYDELPKEKIKKWYVPKNGEPEYEEVGVYRHEPVIVDNAITLRDEFLSDYSKAEWARRGLPNDMDEKTKMWLDTYKYINDFCPKDENDKDNIIDGKFHCTWATVSEIEQTSNEVTEKLKEVINRLIIENSKLELKRLLVQTEEAKKLLDEEAEMLRYKYEDIDELLSQIYALDSETSFANRIVNNPDYEALSDNIRIIMFKTC